MLEIKNLSKRFGNKKVLNDVNFSIESGQIVGLIGPNGSGKTTLLNILMGILSPTSGSFKVEENKKIGMSVSRMGFFDDMTVENNINMYSSLCTNKSNLKYQLKQFGIDFESKTFGKLSAGMKQRVTLFLAFIDKFDLIYLDEPSNHLDIDSIIMLRTVISNMKKNGTSFLLTSHILSDLEKVCDKIVFVRDGRVIRTEKTEILIQHYSSLENAYLDIFNTTKNEFN